MNQSSERFLNDALEKWDRVKVWLHNNGNRGLLMTSQASASWLTGGRSFIGLASERACAKILANHSRLFLITNNIEADRLLEEEIAAEKLFTLCTYNWFEPDGEDKALAACLADLEHADLRQPDLKRIAHESDHALDVRRMRSPLTDLERLRYVDLGEDATNVIESTCLEMRRGETEFSIAARLARGCLERGMEPVLTLVAADDRAFAFRHPLPTGKSVNEYALLSLGARRHGLVCSVSRMVHFGPIPELLKRRHEAVVHVDVTFITGTRPGRRVAEVFAEAASAYAEYGYESEWQNHHQGGLTGYTSREYRAHGASDEVVSVHEAFSWNPTIAGVKSEDTMLVEESENVILTKARQFPQVDVEMHGAKLLRAGILERRL